MNAAVYPPLLVANVDAFELLPLSELKPGDSAVITAVAAETACARRLLSLGFVPGSEVRVLRRAPMGDPTEYEVHGTRFGLRRLEAAWIRVQPR
jgi:Fe2+ transport system protein FeoA